ncbi:MAG: hypothetical protein OEY20_03010 [Gemmatimonadota bacterium]|nr:hypothetical protein [Gemmatimonadota bacterium]MDH4350164.1 hypothetical protein [Gemmatimonadota bacterium]MDH5196206.1 hypothetical protein [Gemmatimonadota bacterium]
MHAAFALAVMIGAALPGSALTQAREIPPGPFMAIARRDLRFGDVLPGIPETVRPGDLQSAGQFEIHGVPEGMVRIEFLLPDALVSAYGAVLPLEFGPSDGYADFSRGRPPRGLIFDPRTPLVAILGPNGRLTVRLGGTVLPARDQAGGKYVATIALTVFDLGS